MYIFYIKLKDVVWQFFSSVRQHLFCMSLDQLSIAIKLPARTDLVLLSALGVAGHLPLLRLDHFFK